MKISAVVATVAAAFIATQAQAQSMDANAMFAQQNAIMQRQMAEAQARIVGNNVRDPRVLQMYYQARAQGYLGTLEQFAYGYAATAGYTARGRQVWADNEASNHAREIESQRGYYGAVQNYGRAVADRNEHVAQNLYDGGLGLQGRQRYYDPAAGMQTERSYVAPGDNGYDSRTGRYYRQDADGNYYSCAQDGCVYVGPAR